MQAALRYTFGRLDGGFSGATALFRRKKKMVFLLGMCHNEVVMFSALVDVQEE